MKDKCFKLYKELCITQTYGAWDTLDEAVKQAKEIYCQSANVDIEYFDFCVMDIWTVLNQVYSWDDILNGSKTAAFQQHYSLLLDDLQRNVEDYCNER